MDANHQSGTVAKNPLYHSLRDGSAGAVTRLLVSVAGGLLLSAVASVMAFYLGYLFPRPGMSGVSNAIFVREEIAAFSYISAGVVYLPFLFWIWSHHRRNRGIWLGAVMTVGLWSLTLAVCVLIDAAFVGEDEFLILGVVCAAGGVTLLGWINLYRRHSMGRSLRDENGVIDLRCPACQYRMVGLKQSRCPECGQEYTLDELVGKQDFEILRFRRSPMGARGQPAEQSQSAETASADGDK